MHALSESTRCTAAVVLLPAFCRLLDLLIAGHRQDKARVAREKKAARSILKVSMSSTSQQKHESNRSAGCSAERCHACRLQH